MSGGPGLGGGPPHPPGSPPPRGRLDALYARLDAFFDRVKAQHGGPSGVTCHAGCSDCCRRFSVTALEAEAIEEGVATLPEEVRARVAARAREEAEACPALEDDGRCAVYAFRPAICRTHGLPIRFAPGSPASPRSLPMVDACPKNFAGVELAALPAASVLDQATVSTVLGALDAARAAEVGRGRGERVEMARVLGRPRAGPNA
jgi:uncharacterized protein